MKRVITGGPGSGKSSVLEVLAGEYHVVPETARMLIEEGHDPCDLESFERKVVERQKSLEAEAPEKDVFLDRSLVDVIAYLENGGLEPWKGLHQDIRQAGYGRVFLLEMLPERLYVQDETRTETYEEASRLHSLIGEAYDRLGYDIVEVPFFPAPSAGEGIARRTEYILENSSGKARGELEGKFRADHEEVREALSGYRLDFRGKSLLKNYVLAVSDGKIARVRDDGESLVLAVKGRNEGEGVNHREELEVRIEAVPGLESKPSYKTIREEYSPLGDPGCTICLDVVEGLGSFVEIEAGSRNQIELWKQRLGIGGECVKESYSEMAVRNPSSSTYFTNSS